jgi:hypothetical protein
MRRKSRRDNPDVPMRPPPSVTRSGPRERSLRSLRPRLAGGVGSREPRSCLLRRLPAFPPSAGISPLGSDERTRIETRPNETARAAPQPVRWIPADCSREQLRVTSCLWLAGGRPISRVTCALTAVASAIATVGGRGCVTKRWAHGPNRDSGRDHSRYKCTLHGPSFDSRRAKNPSMRPAF